MSDLYFNAVDVPGAPARATRAEADNDMCVHRAGGAK